LGQPPIEALLDNVRSVYNVGAIFRTADGAGLAHLHLAGITATPQNPRLTKTALGAERRMGWSYYRNSQQAAEAILGRGLSLWALEAGSRSELLFDVATSSAVCLVVGNELAGVDPALLDMCQRVCYLPMSGIKGSLNVAVAFGIAAYWLRFGKLAGKSQDESPAPADGGQR
jgi:tRNA G18 (ribose-2'-O)-methylase SpoU